MEEKIEIWKDITGYEGKYQISNTGFVKSLSRKGSGASSVDKILSASNPKDKTHYPHVGLCNQGKVKPCMIHRLVAIHFVENPFLKPEVNHIDGNKKNNHYLNLEWCTSRENTMHGLKLGIMNTARGSQKKRSLFTEDEVLVIKKRLLKGELPYKIAKELGIHKGNIQNIKTGKTWKHVLL